MSTSNQTKLQAILRSPELLVVFAEHGQNRMTERGITFFDIQRVLRQGRVAEVTLRSDSPQTIRIAGRGLDGQPIEVVVELTEPATVSVLNVTCPVFESEEMRQAAKGDLDALQSSLNHFNEKLDVANAVNLDASVIPKNRKSVAGQILDAFAAAGFGTHQQVAALANAIAESSLNPAASVESARSYGLFQLNIQGGLGIGHSKEELIRPDVNISIIIEAAKNAKSFPHATSLTTAVAAFVREIERPPDPEGEITRRLKIANALLA